MGLKLILQKIRLRSIHNFAAMFIEDDLQIRWWKLLSHLEERFGKKPDLDAILFLIGMNETGFIKKKITKEEKQDLMHVAVCTILKVSGYYEVEKTDEQG